MGAGESRCPARRLRQGDAHGRHGAGRHRSTAARGSAAAVAEDGGDRPAGRRHRARSQQRADRDRRLRRARARRSAAERIAARRRRRGDPPGGGARRFGHAPAAGVQPEAASRAARVRPQRRRSRDIARLLDAPARHDVHVETKLATTLPAACSAIPDRSSRRSSTSRSTRAMRCRRGGTADARRPRLETSTTRSRAGTCRWPPGGYVALRVADTGTA